MRHDGFQGCELHREAQRYSCFKLSGFIEKSNDECPCSGPWNFTLRIFCRSNSYSGWLHSHWLLTKHDQMLWWGTGCRGFKLRRASSNAIVNHLESKFIIGFWIFDMNKIVWPKMNAWAYLVSLDPVMAYHRFLKPDRDSAYPNISLVSSRIGLVSANLSGRPFLSYVVGRFALRTSRKGPVNLERVTNRSRNYPIVNFCSQSWEWLSAQVCDAFTSP